VGANAENDPAHDDRPAPGDVTLATYETAANQYRDASFAPGAALLAFLDRVAGLVGPGQVLELGSGTGRDADHLESQGVRVTRTDGALAFVQMIRGDGHDARHLDMRSGEFGGPFDAVFSNGALLHLTRDEFVRALTSARRAVVDGGVIAFTLKEGDGEAWSNAKLGLPRLFTYWREPALRSALEITGWTVLSIDHVAGRTEPWLYVLGQASEDTASTHEGIDALLAEQVAYYRARAPVYDQWWNREGEWDLAEDYNRAWRGEVSRLYAATDGFGPSGHVLELAAGTGNLTAWLAQHAGRITAIDSSPEALALNETKLRDQPTPVEYVVADLFSWDPPFRYDVVAFGFWLTHVPHTRFADFWQLVDRALVPGGRVFFVDNALPSATTAPSPVPRGWFRGPVQDGVLSTTNLDTGVSMRRLPGGPAFGIVKHYSEPARLMVRLAELGWDAEVHETGWAFIQGKAQRRGDRSAPR